MVLASLKFSLAKIPPFIQAIFDFLELSSLIKLTGLKTGLRCQNCNGRDVQLLHNWISPPGCLRSRRAVLVNYANEYDIEIENRDVMSEAKEWISFRVKPGEFELIEQYFKTTTCRSLSEYARKVLLSKPVIIKYRNQSADQFLSEMLLFKNELSAIGNNFNQAVKRLHSLDGLAQMRSWLMIYDSTHKSFMNKVDEINNHLVQIYELWSQK